MSEPFPESRSRGQIHTPHMREVRVDQIKNCCVPVLRRATGGAA
jgi:hypothetical protein